MSKLTPSKQDYLEAILDLSVQGAPVRSIDVANALGFSRASVIKLSMIHWRVLIIPITSPALYHESKTKRNPRYDTTGDLFS